MNSSGRGEFARQLLYLRSQSARAMIHRHDSVIPTKAKQYFCHPDRSEAILLSSRPERSGVEGPCVFARRRDDEPGAPFLARSVRENWGVQRSACAMPSRGGWPNLSLQTTLQGAPLKLRLGGDVQLSQTAFTSSATKLVLCRGDSNTFRNPDSCIS